MNGEYAKISNSIKKLGIVLVLWVVLKHVARLVLDLFNLRPLDLTLSFVLAFVVFAFAAIYLFNFYSIDKRLKKTVGSDGKQFSNQLWLAILVTTLPSIIVYLFDNSLGQLLETTSGLMIYIALDIIFCGIGYLMLSKVSNKLALYH